MSDAYTVKFRLGKYRYPVRLTLLGQTIKVEFDYQQDLVTEVKNMAGARWNPNGKFWTVSNNQRNLFTIQFLTEKNPYAPYDIPLVEFAPRRKCCYQHQIEMTRHMLTYKHMIIAGEMGTGKTLSAIECMEASNYLDWMWIGPKSALYSVKLEFDIWEICDICGLQKQEHSKQEPKHPWLTGRCLRPKFYTYEGLRKLITEWPEGKDPPRGLIVDESSRCKNPTAQRTQAVDALATAMRDKWSRDCYIIEMSGSPAPNDPTDWWSQCEIACPGFLKEGDVRKLKNRLAVIEQKENQITGGIYPHLICWKDSVKRCVRCGNMDDHIIHDHATGGHTFEPCVDEVSKLYQRMKGLVHVILKKDCLDLPEKQYRIIKIPPTKELLRAASLLNAKATSAIEALTLCRELSDGFQYKEIEVGFQTCSICKGSKSYQEPFDLENPAEPIDSIAISLGKKVKWFPDGSYEVTDEPYVVQYRTVACPTCYGTGQIPKLARDSIEVKSPKEDVLLNLIDEHEEVGRIVIYGGFQETINKIVRLTGRAGWKYIRVDGRGWDTNLSNRDPLKLLYTFQRDKSVDKIAFIGQPGAAGMGLNLTASPSIVYYSNDFNAESRIQSEDRIHRPGMDVNRGATIYDLILLPSDMLVLNNLKRKRRLQDLTLGQVREEIAAMKWSDVRMM